MKRTSKRTRDLYPRLRQLGVAVNRRADPNAPTGVADDELNKALRKHRLSVRTFSKLFGVQTCGPNGMYPHDVEAVLERMISGARTGSQYLWD